MLFLSRNAPAYAMDRRLLPCGMGRRPEIRAAARSRCEARYRHHDHGERRIRIAEPSHSSGPPGQEAAVVEEDLRALWASRDVLADPRLAGAGTRGHCRRKATCE